MKSAAFCHKGTIEVLRLDLDEILAKKPLKQEERYLVFDADSLDDLLKFAYLVRSATSVVAYIEDFSFGSLQDLEQKLKKIPKKAFLRWMRHNRFRVTCTRSGEHDFRSKDAEEVFGRLIKERFSAEVSLTDYKIDITLDIIDDRAVVGIGLSGFSLDKREMHVMRTQEELNGSIAYSALRLSGYDRRKVLLDPFTGSGNLVIEAALYSIGKSVHFYSKDAFSATRFYDFDFSTLDKKDQKPPKSPLIIGFDSLLRNIRSAKKNAKLAGVSKHIRFAKSGIDWLDTKFSAKEIDCIITAPPFETQLKPKKEIQKIYQELFHQAEYILKDGGVLGLITPRPDTLIESIEHFKEKDRFEVWQGRRRYSIIVLQK